MELEEKPAPSPPAPTSPDKEVEPREEAVPKQEKGDFPPSAPASVPKRQRREWPFRLAIWLIVLVLLALAVATFPRRWGPRLVERIVHWIPPFGDASVTALHIDCITPTFFRATDIRLGGFPAEPSCEEVVVRYSFRNLLRKKVDSVELKGLSITPGYQPGLAYFFGQKSKLVPAAKAPTGKGGVYDPLQGWGVGAIHASTKDIDFASVIPPEAQALFTNLTARAELSVERWHDSYRGRLDGGCLGLPFEGRLTYTPSRGAGSLTLSCAPALAMHHLPLPPSIDATASFVFSDTNGVGVSAKGNVLVAKTPWRLDIRANADSDGVDLRAVLPPTTIDETDRLVASGLVLARPMLEQANISNGLVRVHGSLTSTNSFTIIPGRQPFWEASLFLRDVGGSATIGPFACGVEGGRARLLCSGVGPKWNLRPFRVSFTNAVAGPFPIDGGSGFFAIDERVLTMSRGSVNFCGGTVSLYALYFSFARQNTGFTLYLDNLEVNRLLALVPNIEGTASGQLFGKLPLRIRDGGGEIRLSNAFLYNRPGDRGFIRIPDPSPLTGWMEDNGVPENISRQIGFALKDLQYRTLRLDLTAPRDADGSIGILLEGMAGTGDEKATIFGRAISLLEGMVGTGDEKDKKEGGKPKGVPVNLNINVNGPLERLLNLNLKLKKML